MFQNSTNNFPLESKNSREDICSDALIQIRANEI